MTNQSDWVTSGLVWNVLTDARWLIARGWVQRAFGYGEAFCLVDAIWTADCRPSVFAVALRLVQAEISAPINLVAWNDRRGRTQAEVLALLDRTLLTVEEGNR